MFAQGTTSLLESSAPIWILGICYCDAAGEDAEEGSSLKQEVIGCIPSQSLVPVQALSILTCAATPGKCQVLNAVLSDLMSRIWMTYRRGFPPIGARYMPSSAPLAPAVTGILGLTCMLVLTLQAAQA